MLSTHTKWCYYVGAAALKVLPCLPRHNDLETEELYADAGASILTWSVHVNPNPYEISSLNINTIYLYLETSLYVKVGLLN